MVMKTYKYILMILVSIVLYSCGTTDVWENWDTPDNVNTTVSELKDILVTTGLWKTECEGHTFYFQFNEDKTVISNSDYSIIRDTEYKPYHFDMIGDSLLLTVEGGGHLAALGDNAEETLIVSDMSPTLITAKGQVHGMQMNLVPATQEEVNTQIEAKSMAINGFTNAVIRDGAGKFLAHYTISMADMTIKFITIENRQLIHQDVALTANGTNYTFDAVTVNGQSVSELTYNSAGTGSATLPGTSGLVVTPNNTVVPFYNSGDYRTYVISKLNNKGDGKEELLNELGWNNYIGDVEISDRSARPIVFCPNTGDPFWYVFFDMKKTSDGTHSTGENGDPSDNLIKDELDRAYFTRSAGYEPFGNYGTSMVGPTETALAGFLGLIFSTDGVYMVQENVNGTEYLYFLSPTTDAWIKAQR